MSNANPSGVKHLVIGGSGFLGSNIVNALVKRGEAHVHFADVREAPSYLGVQGAKFHQTDITSPDSINEVLSKVKPDVVYHTASPTALGRNVKLYEKVNVQGTANVVSACQRSEVKALVFTSSGSVVFDGSDLINVDERMPYAAKPFDPYNDTKARAEKLVLEANTDEGAEGLKTCAIRPAGIFGINDRQVIPGIINVAKTRRTNVQIGDNTNLNDFTYVENLVHAHLLAADKLVLGAKPYPRDLLAAVHLTKRFHGTTEPLSFLDRDVPTSENRQDVAGAPDYARQLRSTVAEYTRTDGGVSSIDLRPVIRNRFDQFFHIVNPEVPCAGNPIPEKISIAEDSIKVAGEAFFVTNGQPVAFWEFMRTVWQEYDPQSVKAQRSIWQIPSFISYSLAYCAEWAYWLGGKAPGEGSFDRFKVQLSTASRYYNIEKARRALGYEPLVGQEEAIRRSVAWYKEAEKTGSLNPYYKQ